MPVPLSDIGALNFVTQLVNNTDEMVCALSATAAGTYVFGPFYNPKVALRLGINILAITAGSMTVTLLGMDNTSGATWSIISSTALAATGFTRIEVGPYIAPSANAIAQDYAPVFYEVQVVIATGPVTATIGASGMGG